MGVVPNFLSHMPSTVQKYRNVNRIGGGGPESVSNINSMHKAQDWEGGGGGQGPLVPTPLQ